MDAPQLVWHPPRVPTRGRLRRGIGGIAPKVYAAVGILAMSLVAIGYFAFFAFTDGSTPSLKSAAPQKFLAPSDQSQSPVQLDLRQTDKAIDALIDEVVDAVAMGSVGLIPALLQRIATLEASASPDGLKLLVAMPDRFAARASAAAADGRGDEARRLEQFYRALRELEASSGSAPRSLPETAPASPRTPDQPPPKTDQWQWEGINCPPRDTFKNAQAWVHERLNCERHSTPNEPWIEWAEYCPSGPLGYFVLKVKTGQQKVYLFENITPAFWEGFKAAPAAGKFYHRELKGKRHWFRLASELKPSTCHQ
jgi:KTSC domain